MPIPVKHRPLGVPWEARSNSWKEIDPKRALRELPGGGEELKQFVFVLDAIVQYYDAIANARDRGDPSVAAYVNVTGVPLRLRLLEIANAVTTGISRNQILTVDELDTFLKYSPMLGEYALSLGDQISAPYYARLRGLLLGILWYEAGGAGVRFRRYQLNMQIFSTGPSFTATGPAQDDLGLQPASSVAVYPPQSNYAPPSNIPSGPYQPASYPPPYPPPASYPPQYPPPASYPPGDTRTTTTNTVVNNADGSISKIVKTVTESDTVQELVKNVTQSDTVKQLVKTVTDSGTVEDLVTAAKSLVKDALAKGARGGQDTSASTPKADNSQSRRSTSQEPQTPRQKTPATPRQPAKPKTEEKPPATPRQKPAKQPDTAQEAAQKARDRAEKDAAAREAQLKKEYEEKLKEQLKQAAQKARDREAKKQEAAKTPPPAAKQPKQAKPTPPASPRKDPKPTPPASPKKDPKPPKPTKQTPPTTPRGKKKK